MPSSIALCAWLVVFLGLLLFDPARDRKTSLALWIPVIWMFILGSRNPGQWFDGQLGVSAQGMEEGNPMDRVIFTSLILLSLAILFSRSFNWKGFFARNKALILFLLFALISMCWSDFPAVTLKRWFRDMGSYLAVLLVLSDPRPMQAVRTVLRRLSICLLPLSILLIKYYPQLGREYDEWSGVGYFVGAATSKNMLGLLCLVCGLYLVWDVATQWHLRRSRKIKQVIAMDVLLLSMTVWLLYMAQSTTSDVCLALGSMIILFGHSGLLRRRPGLLKAVIPIVFCLYLVLDFGLGMNGSMAAAVGKDPTLTDRTKIWGFLLSMHTNPLIGTGYQSFWLGSRLDWFWTTTGLGHLNEAHNGYLETYLELGLIGVTLLISFLVSSYRSICRTYKVSPGFGILGLSMWLAFVFYNMSEAASESGLLFSAFLLAAITVPEQMRRLAPKAVAVRATKSAELKPAFSPATSRARVEAPLKLR